MSSTGFDGLGNNAATAPFVAVFEPHTADRKSVRSIADLGSSGTFVALKVTSSGEGTAPNGRVDYVLSSSDGDAHTPAAGIGFTGVFGVASEDCDGFHSLYLGQGRQLRLGDHCLDLDTASPPRLVQATCGTATSQRWKLPERNRVAAWGSAQVAAGRTFTDQTVRMIAHTGVVGAGLRIRLSNHMSTVALNVGKVDLALHNTGGTTVAGSHRTVTFNRSTSLTIAAGAELRSDLIPLAVTAGQNLVISVYLPGTTGASTYHANSHELTYISTAGDFTADDAITNYTTTTKSWFYVSGLDVVAPKVNNTVVAVGDSITDGSSASDGHNKRWPDFLARRLQAEPGGQRLAVANAGIGGNKVLSNSGTGQGQSLLTRFARDVLDQPGVKNVIIYEGINDLSSGKGTGGAALTADMFSTAFRTLIDQAHAKGVRVIGAASVGKRFPCCD